MNDDWRLRIDLHEDGFAHQLSEMLQSEQLEHDLRSTFADRVVVSVDGSEVFCYAGTREQAEAVQRLIERLAGERGWKVEIELTHWHPTAERWEPADEPLPSDAAAADEERERRISDERRESSDQGYPEYEVRVTCDSRAEARALAERLEQEQIACIHRFTWVMIGAADEDSANQLAERLRAELPGKQITAELNMRAVYEQRPGSPFSVFGGLAG